MELVFPDGAESKRRYFLAKAAKNAKGKKIQETGVRRQKSLKKAKCTLCVHFNADMPVFPLRFLRPLRETKSKVLSKQTTKEV
jgi:hypothetical protein